MPFAQIDSAVKEGANLVMQGGALAILAWLVKMLPDMVRMVVSGIENSQASQAKERENRDERFSKTIDIIQDKAADRNAILESAIANQTATLGSKLDQFGMKLDQHAESMNKCILSICKIKTP